MRRLAALVLLIALTGVPALADIYYEAESSSRGENADEQMDMKVKAYSKGLAGKVYIVESSNAWMKQGFYLLTTDGGKTLYLVDPDNETYSLWDLEAILRFAGSILQSLGPVVNFEIQNSKHELVSKETGTMLDLPVTHYVFHYSYDLLIKIIGLKKAQHYDGETEIWATTELADEAIEVWLSREPPEIGYPAFDELARASWANAEGVHLERKDRNTMTNKKGKEQTTWTEFRVLSLDSSAGGPPGGYAFPDHYTQTQMMPTEAELAGQQGGGKDKKKDKKKKKKKG